MQGQCRSSRHDGSSHHGEGCPQNCLIRAGAQGAADQSGGGRGRGQGGGGGSHLEFFFCLFVCFCWHLYYSGLVAFFMQPFMSQEERRRSERPWAKVGKVDPLRGTTLPGCTNVSVTVCPPVLLPTVTGVGRRSGTFRAGILPRGVWDLTGLLAVFGPGAHKVKLHERLHRGPSFPSSPCMRSTSSCYSSFISPLRPPLLISPLCSFAQTSCGPGGDQAADTHTL